jgi:hypothetical protein
MTEKQEAEAGMVIWSRNAADALGDASENENGTSITTGDEASFPAPPFSIVVVPPDTAGNFMEFNIPCENLDSDYLMMPVNEADYDSETQACVDSRTLGPKSFYEHYTTKRKKKRGRKGPIEKPLIGPGAIPAPAVSVVADEVPSASASSTTHLKPEGLPPKPAAPKLTLGVEHPPQDPDHLLAPTLSVPKGALSNAAVRRIACGAMPPADRPKLQATGWIVRPKTTEAPPPPYQPPAPDQ